MRAVQSLALVGDDLRYTLETALAVGSPFTVLLAEALRNRIVLIRQVSPAALWPLGSLDGIRPDKPALVVVGDGVATRGMSLGPRFWSTRLDLATWCEAVIIHAGVPSRGQFEALLEDVHRYRRVAFIECSPETASEWSDALSCPRTVLILPRLRGKGLSAAGTAR